MSPRHEQRRTVRVMIGIALILALLSLAYQHSNAQKQQAQAAIQQQALDTLLTRLGYVQRNPPATSPTSAEEETNPTPRETDRTHYAARFSRFRLAALGE